MDGTLKFKIIVLNNMNLFERDRNSSHKIFIELDARKLHVLQEPG